MQHRRPLAIVRAPALLVRLAMRLAALAGCALLLAGCAARALDRSDAEVLAELPPRAATPSPTTAANVTEASASPAAEHAALLEQGRADAERAALTLAAEDLALAERTLDAALALDPRSGWAHYQRAYAAHARMLASLHVPGSISPERFEVAAESAVRHARVALALQRDRPAESAALLSSIQGVRISGDGWLGMSLGPECDELLAIAEASEPDNPRVVLMRGIALWHAPGMFGGDRDLAREKFARARELFARARSTGDEPAGWPRWGAADAAAWHGQALAESGRLAEARAAYEQALALAPEFGWVREKLISDLDRKGGAR